MCLNRTGGLILNQSPQSSSGKNVKQIKLKQGKKPNEPQVYKYFHLTES